MAVSRFDGWRSAITKLGTAFDKFTSYDFTEPKILQPEECSKLYHFNGLAAKVCDVLAEDALREGLCVKDDSGAEIDELQSRLTDLNAVQLLTNADVFGAALGIAGIYLGVKDGQTQDKPLDPTRVSQVEFLRLVDRRDLAVSTWYGDPLSPKFNTPELLTFTQAGTDPKAKPIAGVRVHESRFLWFGGARTATREARNKNGGWPFSKLQRVYEQLLKVGVSWDAGAQLLHTCSQTVMKIEGLREAIASKDGGEALEKRAMLIDTARSITRSLWIDTTEEVTQLTASLAGVSDVMDRQAQLLAAVTGIPITKLLGTQPTGLGATGAADERSWNNRVEAHREQDIKPQVDKLVACLAAELGVSGDVTISFPSLDRPTAAEEADIKLKTAQTDAIYVTNQIVLPEEIATSRFGGPAYSTETHLQDGPRDALEFPAPPGSPDPEEVASEEDKASNVSAKQA